MTAKNPTCSTTEPGGKSTCNGTIVPVLKPITVNGKVYPTYEVCQRCGKVYVG